MRKSVFCMCQNMTQISFAVTPKLISAFVFATRIVQFLYFLNPEFQASSNLLWLYSVQPVLCGTRSKTLKTGFLTTRLNYHLPHFKGWNVIGFNSQFFFSYAYAKTKTQISFTVTAKLISAFVFATRIVQPLYFLITKFQASSHLL